MRFKPSLTKNAAEEIYGSHGSKKRLKIYICEIRLIYGIICESVG